MISSILAVQIWIFVVYLLVNQIDGLVKIGLVYFDHDFTKSLCFFSPLIYILNELFLCFLYYWLSNRFSIVCILRRRLLLVKLNFFSFLFSSLFYSSTFPARYRWWCYILYVVYIISPVIMEFRWWFITYVCFSLYHLKCCSWCVLLFNYYICVCYLLTNDSFASTHELYFLSFFFEF